MDQKPLLGIVGTGMIGIGLAALFTGNGYPAVIYVRDAGKKELCRSRYSACLDALVKNEKITQRQVEICSRYLTITCDYSDFADVEYVFEAVPESLEVKREVYGQLERHCRSLKALASTTSSFSADVLAGFLTVLKEHFLIAHPFNPPHVVLFFEIVRPPETSVALMEDLAALLKDMHRQVVCLKKEVPGCIGNRLQYALFREAIHLVEQGVASPEDIDTALRYSFAPRYTNIGLFEHLDNAGLDLFQTAGNALYPGLCDATEAQQTVNELVRGGHLGCKSGQGFYQWDAAKIHELGKRAIEPYLEAFCWNVPEE